MFMKSFRQLLMVMIFVNFTSFIAYGSEYFDNQELSKALEFCHSNDQASDLCYLLAQDVLDYHNYHDISLDDYLSEYDQINYAQGVAVVSIPIFLRYFPLLSRLAKNNMIITSVISLVTAAIIFKDYYDTFSDSLIMKITENSSGTSPDTFKEIQKLKTSKKYQYYSQKGPEHENTKLLPLLRKKKKQQDIDNIDIVKITAEYKKFIKSASKWIKNNHLNKKLNFTVTTKSQENLQHIQVLDYFANLQAANLAFVNPKQQSQSVQDNYDQELYKLVDNASQFALIFFNREKFEAANSTIDNVLNRHILTAYKIMDKNVSEKVWNALLLEHISHLELLENNKNPEFEEKVYLPFLKAQFNSLDIRTPQAKTAIKNDSSLLPSQYLDYQELNIKQLKAYFIHRKLMWSVMLNTVQGRVNVWNRKEIYQFLPEKAKSDQAFKDWSELLKLSTHPLLYDFYNYSKKEN